MALRKPKTTTKKPAAKKAPASSKPAARVSAATPVASPPAAPSASDIRRKKALLDELKDNDTPWIRRHAIYNDLDELASVPILSAEEIRRLG